MGIEFVKDEIDKKRPDPQKRFDPFRVENGQKGFRYRFLNKNERNMERKRWDGYEVVKDNDPERLSLTESTPVKKSSDLGTTRGFADVILARIPEERMTEKDKANRELIAHRTGAPKSDFRSSVGSTAFEGEGGGGWSGSMSQSEFEAQQAEKAKGGK